MGGQTNVFFLLKMVISTGLSDILEADAKQIANMARETFEKYGTLLLPIIFWIFYMSRLLYTYICENS